jgi:hypothetical protein
MSPCPVKFREMRTFGRAYLPVFKAVPQARTAPHGAAVIAPDAAAPLLRE